MSTIISPNASSTKPSILDDKSPHCIPFILSLLKTHHSHSSSTTKPFFIGLNGVQGAGKTTLVSSLAHTLQNTHGLQTLVCSIDDLYLRHEDQVLLAESQKDNPLVQHRGEPGTHDMALARDLFGKLSRGEEVAVPEYDKSQYGGQGDRVPQERWKVVNRIGGKKIEVVIFEGWCVGFRRLSEEEVVRKRDGKNRTLKTNRLEDLLFVNGKLGEYEVINEALNAFIHIDAEEMDFVYQWRQEQEAALRRETGNGMSEEMVKKFVDGYYPAYEMYTVKLREGLFKDEEGGEGKQLRLIVGRDRRVKEVIQI